MARLLVAGCGFVGQELARRAAALDWTVEGWTRTGGAAERQRSSGEAGSPNFTLRTVDLADADAVRTAVDTFQPDACVHCASSGRGGPAAYRSVFLSGICNLVQAAPRVRMVFTSSTSVYSQIDGSVVTEASPAEPGRETGRILLEAERVALETGGAVARLAGIYGPGRSAHLRKLLEGEAAIEGDGARWINQIHRDDAAAALFQVAQRGVASGIYNVSDNEPLQQFALYEFLASHLAKPMPPRAEPDMDRKRGWTNKRVSNARLRGLGWNPRFPSFQTAILAGAV